jgi:hypothetical protein
MTRGSEVRGDANTRWRRTLTIRPAPRPIVKAGARGRDVFAVAKS